MAKVAGSPGYTFIELVVVVGLVSMLSVGLVSIFSSSIKGSSAARVEAEVKSQGDYAISLMERSLRMAATEPSCSATPPSVTFQVMNEARTLETRSFSFTAAEFTIQNQTGSSIFGEDVVVSDVNFECLNGGTFGLGSVTVSFSLTANGKMNQRVTQQFKTTVAIRSVP